MFKAFQNEKYSRQILLQEFGEVGQQKLLNAKVLVVGAGGLGCPILQYLTAAGVGKIGIADDDIVSLSNLHRQILYGHEDVGKPKAETAAKKLQQLNNDTHFTIFNTRITNTNAWDIFKEFDIVVDGSDNFSTRYLVNDVCVLLHKPLIYGSVYRFEGQVSVFNLQQKSAVSANYRDLFPTPPMENEVPDCAEAGVIGVLPGIIGSMMANETIKVITGIGKTFANTLLTYNSLFNSFFEIAISKNENRWPVMPQSRQAFESWNYTLVCTTPKTFKEIDASTFTDFVIRGNALLIDVREPEETPEVTEFEYQKMPLSKLEQMEFSFGDKDVVVFCQSGKRSSKAAELIAAKTGNAGKIFSLKGGISAWKKLELNKQHEQQND